MRLLLLAMLIGLTSCSSKKAVNDDTTPALAAFVPSYGVGSSAQGDFLARQSKAGISGQLFLKSQISSILPNTRINLYQWQKNQWKLISELSTDIEGKFSITQALFEGRYELRVANPKYVGQLPVVLDEKPVKDLIFEVTLK